MNVPDRDQHGERRHQISQHVGAAIVMGKIDRERVRPQESRQQDLLDTAAQVLAVRRLGEEFFPRIDPLVE
jgi:hypothetical protein